MAPGESRSHVYPLSSTVLPDATPTGHEIGGVVGARGEGSVQTSQVVGVAGAGGRCGGVADTGRGGGGVAAAEERGILEKVKGEVGGGPSSRLEWQGQQHTPDLATRFIHDASGLSCTPATLSLSTTPQADDLCTDLCTTMSLTEVSRDSTLTLGQSTSDAGPPGVVNIGDLQKPDKNMETGKTLGGQEHRNNAGVQEIDGAKENSETHGSVSRVRPQNISGTHDKSSAKENSGAQGSGSHWTAQEKSARAKEKSGTKKSESSGAQEKSARAKGKSGTKEKSGAQGSHVGSRNIPHQSAAPPSAFQISREDISRIVRKEIEPLLQVL